MMVSGLVSHQFYDLLVALEEKKSSCVWWNSNSEYGDGRRGCDSAERTGIESVR